MARQDEPVAARPAGYAAERRGFTLVELLVVIAIIGLLIGLLVPLVSYVRRKAWETESRNFVSNLTTACEQYQTSFRAYPGPLSNDKIEDPRPGDTPPGVTGNVTMAENLVLGLCGGLTSAGAYDQSLIGTGPISRNGNEYKQHDAFVGGVVVGKNLLSAGQFKDDVGIVGSDSTIPEFVDKFPNAMPILYLRARRGATGVMSDGSTTAKYQYDLRHIQAYTGPNFYGAASKLPSKQGGLKVLGTYTAGLKSEDSNDALPYFKNPAFDSATPTNVAGTPRSKDGFILISAGADGVFGTLDDITNAGEFR